MGRIKKLKETDLVGGAQSTDVYPITSTLAVYDGQNKVLEDYLTHLRNTATFVGIAIPETNPGTPTSKVFYIAKEKGTYRYFGKVITEDEVIILLWDSATWRKLSTGIPSKEKLDTKQDTISDLATIRSGAAKGATALQSYTETDPVYTADKPSLALKSEIPDISGKVDKVAGKGLSTNDYTNEDKAKLDSLQNYDDTQVRELIAGKANLQHQHMVADITDFPELYYDATTFFTSGAYPSDKYEELLEAVKAKKTIYATLDEEGNISYVFFMSLANSDGSSSRVLLTTNFADGGFLYLNTFVLQQSGMTRIQENITSKANKATTLAGYGIGDAYTKSEVDATIDRKQDKTSLVSDLATQVNALSSSDKAAFLGQIGAASEESLKLHENDNTRHITDAERTKWNAKQDALTLTIKDNGNIVIANIQGQSQEFMPATPSGDPMHYAYEAAGAVWNGTGADIVKTGEFTGEDIIHKSGHWYYNELGDISNEQMRDIYVVGNRLLPGNASSMAYAYQPIRTNLYTNKYNQGSWLRVDLYSIAINYSGETLRLCEGAANNIIYAGRVDRSFSRATNLKKILGVIILPSNYTDYKDFFIRCFKLQYVRLRSVANNLSLSDSSYLQESSILYMIENEAATSAITITLHADAYARAMANADIVAALQAHPNVSLASA